MRLHSSYRYVAQATAMDGRHLADLTLEPDFAPAAECAHLAGVRAGALPANAHHGPGVVEPVYHRTHGRPYIEAVRVQFDAAAADRAAPTISSRCLDDAVEQASARLVEARKLEAGETFHYRVCAFPLSQRPNDDRRARAPQDDDSAVALTFVDGGVDALRADAARLAAAAWDDADVPLYMHRAVLEQTTRIARADHALESGGLLAGGLRREPGSPEVHVEVSVQIEAKRARAGHSHLGFTPETWSAMRDALALRRRGELILGWWHFHPHFCRRCPLERRSRCALARPFFSRDDRALHRTVFDAAFNVALLLSDTGGSALEYDLFGWRDGRIAARGAYLVDAPAVAAMSTPAASRRAPPRLSP